ncbi:MAG: RNA methyltransferase [Deltaproteobacteria bacterium]|nr:RNA methyltransferase [Deltaproteobacteria bacterium]
MDLFDSIYIILVKPEKIRNIGQIARAMKNFGFSKLRIICPPMGNMREAYENAVNAKDIIDNREVFGDIKAATLDLNLLIGTSSRDRLQPLSPWELADMVISNPHLKYGILFGTEFRGLSNKELDLCHKVVSIPTSEAYPSMNISHAVCIICYELKKGFIADASHRLISSEPLASISEIENLIEHSRRTLSNIGFLKESAPGHLVPILRRLSTNINITSKDIRILRGILRQIDWIYSKSINIEENR